MYQRLFYPGEGVIVFSLSTTGSATLLAPMTGGVESELVKREGVYHMDLAALEAH